MSEANLWLNAWLMMWGLAAVWSIVKTMAGGGRE